MKTIKKLINVSKKKKYKMFRISGVKHFNILQRKFHQCVCLWPCRSIAFPCKILQDGIKLIQYYISEFLNCPDRVSTACRAQIMLLRSFFFLIELEFVYHIFLIQTHLRLLTLYLKLSLQLTGFSVPLAMFTFYLLRKVNQVFVAV